MFKICYCIVMPRNSQIVQFQEVRPTFLMPKTLIEARKSGKINKIETGQIWKKKWSNKCIEDMENWAQALKLPKNTCGFELIIWVYHSEHEILEKRKNSGSKIPIPSCNQNRFILNLNIFLSFASEFEEILRSLWSENLRIWLTTEIYKNCVFNKKF